MNPRSNTLVGYARGVAAPIRRIKLNPELPEQVFGYWFGEGERVPSKPVGAPTGAVLPRPGATLSEASLLCLDLVPVENYWLVLTELGRYTYRHTSGLLQKERWFFVPVPDAVGRWPARFEASSAPSLPWEELDLYGIEARARARQDAPAVQLRLRRAGR